jgi:hypothetical protein
MTATYKTAAGAFLCGLVLFAASAGAQTAAAKLPAPIIQEGASLHFDAAGHRFTVPAPDWLTAAERLSPDVMGLIESNYYADPLQAFVEFFPKGQSLEDWRTTYAARITLEAGRSLEDYRRASIFGYSHACKPEATGIFYFGEETADFFPALGFVCGAYRDDIEALRGQGEVMVSVFRKSDAGVAVVYQEWKGPAFDPSNPATWPVTTDALQARADQLQADAKLLLRAD